MAVAAAYECSGIAITKVGGLCEDLPDRPSSKDADTADNLDSRGYGIRYFGDGPYLGVQA